VFALDIQRTERDLDLGSSRLRGTMTSSTNTSHSLPPLHLSSSVDDDVISVTSYHDTPHRTVHHSYTLAICTVKHDLF